jgi:hypothetical protein
MDPSAFSNSKHKLTSLTEEHINSGDPNSDDPLFVSVCESWLKPHISDAQVNIPNYQIVRQDRMNRSRGGVILYVHNSLPTSNVRTFDDGTCEAVMCYIKSINTIVTSIYRPPDTSVSSFENLLKFIQETITEIANNNHCDLILMGDFNLPSMHWQQSDPSAEPHTPSISETKLSQFMEDNLLSQYIDKPTRQKNILDLFITNNPNIVLKSDISDTSLSDHKIIKVTTTYNLKAAPKSKPKIPQHTFRSLNLQKADYNEINSHLKSINWDELQEMCSPDEFPELLRLTVLQVCALYSPNKSDQSNKMNPFMRNRNILRRRKRKVKSQISAISVKNPNSRKLEKLRSELYDINQNIKDSIFNQRKEKESKAVKNIIKNPRFFYSYAKQNNKLRSTVGPLLNEEGDLIHHPKTMADILQKQYSSVFSDPLSAKKKKPKICKNCKINSTLENFDFTTEDIVKAINEINEGSACGDEDIPAMILKKCKEVLSYPIFLLWKQSLNSGYVPKVYKNQIITPVHKKESKAEAANYRPISLTSHIIKIFERLIRNHIVNHLEKNHLICKNQHGFRKHRSCLTQLLSHIDIILQNFQNNMDTDVIYLDYAKAFDKVDHQILLQKLHAYGIRGKMLMWLNSYLSNRWQTVVINGEHSQSAKVISGVPQGTVLGPVLFILFLNDLEACIQHSIISSFADDTRLKKAINVTSDTRLLQKDLDHSIQWSDESNMKLHQNKFELVSHATDNSKLLKELPFFKEFSEYSTDDGSVISPINSVRDLGITITSDVSWSPHISTITDDARRMASWIFSVFIDRNAATMMPLFQALVRSRTEYCSPLWNPSKLEDIKKLESVQRAFTARIHEVKHLGYWDRLKALNLMSLQRRRERYIIIHVFKIIHDLAPNDINMQFQHTNRRGLCCRVPLLIKNCKAKHQSQYDDSFHVVGARLWNLLPRAIKQKDTLSSFKSALTKFIILPPDHPPVPGIASENSLLQLLASDRATWRNLLQNGGSTPSDEDTSDEDGLRMA